MSSPLVWGALFDFSGLASSLCSNVSPQGSLEERGFNVNCIKKANTSSVGIGALLATVPGLKDSPWYVSGVTAGSTAHIAGLEPFDLIIQVRNFVGISETQCNVLI